jgi:hypothetical protein
MTKDQNIDEKHNDESDAHHGHNDHFVTVRLNQTEVSIEKKTYTTESLKAALGVDPSLALDIVEDGIFRPLKDGEETKVKKGMMFVSHVVQGSSS